MKIDSRKSAMHADEVKNQRRLRHQIADQKKEQTNEIQSENQRSHMDEEFFTEIASEQYFAKDVSQESVQSRSDIVAQRRETYVKNAMKQNANQLQLSDDLQDSVLQKDGLNAEQVESFLDIIDVGGHKKQKFTELAEKLMTCREGEEEGLIDKTAIEACGDNKGAIYLMLAYVSEYLGNKNAKEKLKERLKKIMDSFERQESGYLSSFFSFQEVLKSNPESQISGAMLDKMANISAGNMKLNSLRQTLQFIGQSLPDKDMHKMVSIFMKFQAKSLKKIASLSEGREGKEEMANILQQERNLIILNSLYNLCRKLFTQLQKSTHVDEKYGEFMLQVINIIESSVVSADNLQNMERIMGTKDMNMKVRRSFINGFQGLIGKMPQPIFHSEAMKEKIIESLKNIMTNIDKLLEPKSKGLSFLKHRSGNNVK